MNSRSAKDGSRNIQPDPDQAAANPDVKLRSVAILGSGKMGEALARGFAKAGVANRIVAADVLPERVEAMKRIGVAATSDRLEAVKETDVVVIAVKPKDVAALTEEIASAIGRRRLVISIAAGVTLKTLERRLPSCRIVRAMPNIAATVQEAITALTPGRFASKEDLKTAESLFAAVGGCVVVDEGVMDAVTGLSGSGPGYIFLVIEALADAGVKIGLPHAVALKLAAQTTLGAAKMVLESGLHPAELKSMVATPGGTTIEGLHVMEKAGIRGVLMETVEAATRRAKEISQSIKT